MCLPMKQRKKVQGKGVPYVTAESMSKEEEAGSERNINKDEIMVKSEGVTLIPFL